MEYTPQQQELLNLLTTRASRDMWFDTQTLLDVQVFQANPQCWGLLLTAAKQQGIHGWQWERAVEQSSVRANGTHALPLFRPQTMTELLKADIAPLHEVVTGFLHEGLWMFGGKSKRGKSWLMLDIALAVACGRAVFGHFPSVQSPVLYLALEDGQRRVRSRVLAIEPTIAQRDDLHMAYEFPRLGEGGIETLTQAIDQYSYGLVIIDVLAKVRARHTRGKTGEGYQELYDELGPLHALAQASHATIILLEHLRKQEAEDIFDAIQGSVAKQGSADALMVLERKAGEDDTYLHVLSKETESLTHALRFDHTHFVYAGEGDAYAMKQQRRAILQVLKEEARALGISDLLHAMGEMDTSANYQRARRNLLSLVEEGYVICKEQGQMVKFLATVLQDKAEYDDTPF